MIRSKLQLLIFYFLVMPVISFAQTQVLLRGGIDISSNMVHNIMCDRRGCIWLATDNGMNRLDGASNKVIYNQGGTDNRFSCSFQDSTGRIWFGAAGIVQLYNCDSEKLTIVEAYTVDNEKIPINPNMILERRNGQILVCTTGHGIFMLSKKRGKLTFEQAYKQLPFYYVTFIFEDNKGVLWLCTEKGVIRYDGRKFASVKCNGCSNRRLFSSVTQTSDGAIWCANYAGGVWRVNPKTLQTQEIAEMKGVGVQCMLASNKGELLIGTNTLGVWRVKRSSMQASQMKLVVGGVSDNRFNVHSMVEDVDHNLWVACFQKGVLIVPNESERFGYIGKHSSIASLIGNDCVMSMSYVKGSSSQKVWIAADGDGMYCLEGNHVRHVAPSASMPRTVMSQLCDSKGRLWLGTWRQGLWVMDANGSAARRIELPIDGDAYSIFALAEDKYGQIWVGTLGEGVFCLDAMGNVKAMPKVTTGLAYRETMNVIPNNWIYDFALGDDDIIYVATCDGLGAIDVKTGNCLRGFRGKNRLFGRTVVNSVCHTRDGRLWVGCTNGLYEVNLKTLDMKLITRNDGVNGNEVRSMIDDSRGSLWISTNVGISRMLLKNSTIVRYSAHDGMFGNEFSRNAVCMSGDGRLWFGGTEGICVFRPQDVARPTKRPHIVITGLYVNGTSVNTETLSDGKPIIDRNIMDTDHIQVAYENNTVVLELSTLDYIHRNNITYQYQIDNGQWQTLPMGNNSVVLNELNSGNHTICFRAMMHDAFSATKTLTIYVGYPWFFSWWAWVLYIAFGVMIVLFVRNRIHQNHVNAINLLKIRQQEEMVEAKTQFFMDVSHEIRTPMSLIVAPLQQLITIDKDEERQNIYRRMNRNAQRILQLINQILDLRKIEKGQITLSFREVSITPLMEEIVEGFRDLAERRDVRLSYHSSMGEKTVWIDPVNFEKIVTNLLVNAFKYTPEKGDIAVTTTADADSYSITVTDNGCGINEEDIDRIFDRFYQTKMQTPQSLSMGGFGLGLNLTHKLVTMHHGKVTCRNNSEGGCTFCVTLPLGDSHLSAEEKAMAANTIPAMIAAESAAEGLSVADSNDAAKQRARWHMLIVEDDAEVGGYLKTELAKNFAITLCSNGKEAMELLHKHTKCDIILCDIIMPVMDGMELLHNIRQNVDFNMIPVILLTSMVNDEDVVKGIEMGADAFITKPFNIEVLRSTARRLILRSNQLKNIYNGSQNPSVQTKLKVLSPDEKLMQRILKVINQNLSNPNLNNELVTREISMSRAHLYRKMKELTNQSLSEFVRNIRLTEAARLLREQKHNISEVAYSTGFDNISYFSNVFKQKYGVSPLHYREQTQKEHKENNIDDEEKSDQDCS